MFEYIHNSCTSHGVPPPPNYYCAVLGAYTARSTRSATIQKTLHIDTTFKINSKQRPFLMICGKDADGELYIFLRVYL
jgi:hypothetical protein